jgi:hypothetical protein
MFASQPAARWHRTMIDATCADSHPANAFNQGLVRAEHGRECCRVIENNISAWIDDSESKDFVGL